MKTELTVFRNVGT